MLRTQMIRMFVAAALLAVSALALPGCPACYCSLKVDNQSVNAITELYFVQTGSDSWGDNKISAPIAAHNSQVFTNIPAAMMYDILAVFDSGKKVEKYGVYFECDQVEILQAVPVQ